MFLLGFFYSQSFAFVCLLILSGIKINILIILYTFTSIYNDKNKTSSSERIRELKNDSITFATEQKLSTLEFCTDDIVKIIKSLDPNKAHGHDEISI